MPTIGERLKELRESLGYSVDDFAKILEVHRSSIYRYEGTNEAEQRDLPMSIAIKIAQKFNVSLDWLAGRSDVKNVLPEECSSLSTNSINELIHYATFLKNKELGK